MLVHGRALPHREHGRRSRSGWRSRPGGEGRHEHLRSRWTVTQRPVRPHRVVVTSPALDDDLRFPQRGEDLPIQQLVPKPTSVTPIERTASATGVPWAISTSTWRSLATISSGLCLFLDMGPSFFGSREPCLRADHFKGGSLFAPYPRSGTTPKVRPNVASNPVPLMSNSH